MKKNRRRNKGCSKVFMASESKRLVLTVITRLTLFGSSCENWRASVRAPYLYSQT